MTAINFHDLHKTYGKTKALQGINGRVEPGRTIAITGGNGSGKSTFLKILAGVLLPDSGGIDPIDARASAFMPERVAFSRGWTAHDWLGLQAAWRGIGRLSIEAILAEAELVDVQHKPVTSFSHGMVRRLLYAQTRLGSPSLVILDEPEGGLDPLWMLKLEQEIGRLHQQGVTVVLATHAIDLAVDVSDELWVFRAGAIISQESSAAWRSLDSIGRRHRLAEMLQS